MEQAKPVAGEPGTGHVPVRRPRVVSAATATILGSLVLVLGAVYVPLAGLVHQLAIGDVGEPAVILVFAGVGVVIVRGKQRNPIGWILLVFSFLFIFSGDAGYYAVLCYRLGHHGLPFAPAAVLLEPLWVPAVALFPLVILLFPDGRLTSQRWQRVLWAYAALAAYFMTIIWVSTIAAVASHGIRLDSIGDVTDAGHGTAAKAAAALVLVSIGVIWLSFVAHQVRNWRRALGERRQQLKWLACGAAITLVSFALSIPSAQASWDCSSGSGSPPCRSASAWES